MHLASGLLYQTKFALCVTFTLNSFIYMFSHAILFSRGNDTHHDVTGPLSVLAVLLASFTANRLFWLLPKGASWDGV